MSDEINSRADAKLKRLPMEVHCEIVERLSAPGVTQLDVLAWLKSDQSVACSPASFSRSLPFIRQRVKSHGREQVILAKMSERKSQHPELSDTDLFSWGQREFQVMAIADEDPDAWVKLQRAQRDRESLSLERQKFELQAAELMLDKALRAKADEINNSPLSFGEKIAAMRQAAFKSVDELQASGTVVIPKS